MHQIDEKPQSIGIITTILYAIVEYWNFFNCSQCIKKPKLFKILESSALVFDSEINSRHFFFLGKITSYTKENGSNEVVNNCF